MYRTTTPLLCLTTLKYSSLFFHWKNMYISCFNGTEISCILSSLFYLSMLSLSYISTHLYRLTTWLYCTSFYHWREHLFFRTHSCILSYLIGNQQEQREQGTDWPNLYVYDSTWSLYLLDYCYTCTCLPEPTFFIYAIPTFVLSLLIPKAEHSFSIIGKQSLSLYAILFVNQKKEES